MDGEDYPWLFLGTEKPISLTSFHELFDKQAPLKDTQLIPKSISMKKKLEQCSAYNEFGNNTDEGKRNHSSLDF